jgi:hypothetical protein
MTLDLPIGTAGLSLADIGLRLYSGVQRLPLGSAFRSRSREPR